MTTPSPSQHDYHKSHAYHSTSAVGASAVEEIEAHHQEHEEAAKVVEEARGGGVSTFDYLISLMGYAIGIGNVWRFPYLVGRNGGCAFVVAYLICLFLIASPMYLLELIWGNTSRRNPIGTFRMMSPRFVGVAYASVALLVFVVSYYNMLLSYALVYLVNSFYSPLPWTYEALPPNKRHDLSPSEHFYYNEVLARYDPGVVTRAEFDGLGALQWPLVLGLLVVYMIVFLTLFRGMEASAKVTYVTVGLPVALIVVLFIRGITLDGASDGIEFYIGKFEWSKLGKIDVWADAAGQILFSLSPGMGTAITLSSYTKKKEDVFKINILVTICNSCFSLFAGFAVFSILGFMSKRRCDEVGLECVSVEELASKSGSGLAFIVLAEGVSLFGSGSNIFSLFFFFMLLTLGLDSTFAWMETLITYSDDWVTERRTRLGGLEWCTKPVIVGLYCVFFFLVGLLYCTPLGGPLLDVVDNWAGSYIMIAICFFESIMLSWWWTWDRLVLNLQNATKGLPGLPNGRVLGRFSYWRVTMMFTAPVLCLVCSKMLKEETHTRHTRPSTDDVHLPSREELRRTLRRLP